MEILSIKKGKVYPSYGHRLRRILTARAIRTERMLSACSTGVIQMSDRPKRQKGSLKAMQMALGCMLLAGVAAAEPGVRVEVVGGTLPDLPPKAGLRLILSGADSLVFR